jgi:hypothetical protein
MMSELFDDFRKLFSDDGSTAKMIDELADEFDSPSMRESLQPPVPGTAREYFKKIHQDLQKDGWRPDGPDRIIRPDPKLYPSVELMYNGTVFGTHKDLRKYLKANQVTGKRGKPPVMESHHLLEKNFMKRFRITDDEGLAVALEEIEHVEVTNLVSSKLRPPRHKLFHDIDDLYRGHASVYTDINYSSWISRMRDFLRQNRARIRAVYESGDVPGAHLPDWQARLARVQKFLDEL